MAVSFNAIHKKNVKHHSDFEKEHNRYPSTLYSSRDV